ncbi:hypothetical protein C0993_005413, partial [Termitomyces sp. T159_Od127]
MFGSLYHGNKNKNPPPAAPLPPPAFPQKKNAFAPPPSRTAASEPPARQPEPEPQPQPAEEESRGEWAVALYDYTSQVNLVVSVIPLGMTPRPSRKPATSKSRRTSTCWSQNGRRTI